MRILEFHGKETFAIERKKTGQGTPCVRKKRNNVNLRLLAFFLQKSSNSDNVVVIVYDWPMCFPGPLMFFPSFS